jgi:hypothetical protein
VRSKDQTVTREGFGAGEAQGQSLGEAHDKAIKTAETDATKRALATFGKPFGLSLYLSKTYGRPPHEHPAHDRSSYGQPPHGGANGSPAPGRRAEPEHDQRVAIPTLPATHRRRTAQRLGANGRFYTPHQAKTVVDPEMANALRQRSTAPEPVYRSAPLPSPDAASAPVQTESTHPVAAAQPCVTPSPQPPAPPLTEQAAAGEAISTSEQAPDERAHPSPAPVPGLPSALPVVSPEPLPDSRQANDAPSVSPMLINRPIRRREPLHLKFVGQQPCLLCSRTPSDAHHLKFAQPRALGRKVSDEFTVPLCRIHHRQLHESGNEVAWWIDMDIDPLPIAQGLWEEFWAKQKPEPEGAPLSPADALAPLPVVNHKPV